MSKLAEVFDLHVLSKRNGRFEVTEALLKNLVGTLGVRDFSLALRNSFSHGECCSYVSDDDLESIFEGLDKIALATDDY